MFVPYPVWGHSCCFCETFQCMCSFCPFMSSCLHMLYADVTMNPLALISATITLDLTNILDVWPDCCICTFEHVMFFYSGLIWDCKSEIEPCFACMYPIIYILLSKGMQLYIQHRYMLYPAKKCSYICKYMFYSAWKCNHTWYMGIYYTQEGVIYTNQICLTQQANVNIYIKWVHLTTISLH